MKYIREETWNADFWLVAPAQNPELKKFIKKEFPGATIHEDLDDGGFAGRCFEILDKDGDEVGFVIALRDWDGDPEDYSVLAHECLHAVHYCLSNRGLKLNNKSEEAYCYLLDSLLRRCAEFLND